MSTGSKGGHPGAKYLLPPLLAQYPAETRRQVENSFASVEANVEFCTWIPLDRIHDIADEANRKGFKVWVNSDTSSAIIYGAGSLSSDAAAAALSWVNEITIPGQELAFCTIVPGEKPNIVMARKPRVSGDNGGQYAQASPDRPAPEAVTCTDAGSSADAAVPYMPATDGGSARFARAWKPVLKPLAMLLIILACAGTLAWAACTHFFPSYAETEDDLGVTREEFQARFNQSSLDGLLRINGWKTEVESESSETYSCALSDDMQLFVDRDAISKKVFRATLVWGYKSALLPEGNAMRNSYTQQMNSGVHQIMKTVDPSLSIQDIQTILSGLEQKAQSRTSFNVTYTFRGFRYGYENDYNGKLAITSAEYN